MKCLPFTVDISHVLRMITQNLLMFNIDETRYYYSARVSCRMFFVRRLCSHLRMSWMEKKTENLIGGMGEGVGIRISWVEKFRKIN